MFLYCIFIMVSICRFVNDLEPSRAVNVNVMLNFLAYINVVYFTMGCPVLEKNHFLNPLPATQILVCLKLPSVPNRTLSNLNLTPYFWRRSELSPLIVLQRSITPLWDVRFLKFFQFLNPMPATQILVCMKSPDLAIPAGSST